MNRKNKYILAIETSCDDTCISILKNNEVISDVRMTSLNQHRKYGGIVPEIASRSHEECIANCYIKAVKQAKIKPSQLTHVVYTNEPGLPGSIFVGKSFAKTIGMLLHIPVIPINHMFGHVFSFMIDQKTPIKFPMLSLVVSGGHTTIYLFESFTKYQILNETSDDAVGETLDKIGRMLKLPYPGGISIDKIYDENKTNLKMINHYQPEMPFSFSGIKTHILNYLNQQNMKNNKVDKVLVASSALKWIIEEVMIKVKYYINKYEPKLLTIGGGVSANQLLRKYIQKLNIKWYIPKLKYTGDNASMIGNYYYITSK